MREWELDPETYSGEVVTELKLMLRVRSSVCIIPQSLSIGADHKSL